MIADAAITLRENAPGVSLGTSAALDKCHISRTGGTAYCSAQDNFEVIDLAAGHSVSRAKFQDTHGAVLKITSFVEFDVPLDPDTDDDSVARRTAPVIVIGLYNEGNGQGHVRAISPETWNVLCTTEVSVKPTNLAVVGFTNTLNIFPAQSQSAVILDFTFATVVGDDRGKLYLIDLPFHLSEIDPEAPDVDVPTLPSPHQPISMGQANESKWKYSLSKTDAVTAITYLEVLHTVAVGYSFGGVQLWDILTLTLMSETPREDGLGPVTHFLFQQLEHDDCSRHLWACHGSSGERAASVSLELYRAEGRPGHWALDKKRTETLTGPSGAGRVLSADALVEKSLQSDSHMLAVSRDGGLRHGVVTWQEFLSGGRTRYELVLIDLGMLESLPDDSGGRTTAAEDFALQHFASRHTILGPDDGDLDLVDLFVDPYSVVDWTVLGADAIRAYDNDVRTVFLGLSDTMSFKGLAVGQGSTIEVSFQSRSDQVLSALANKAPEIFVDEDALNDLYNDCWLLGLIHDHARDDPDADLTGLAEPANMSHAEKRWELFNLALERGLVNVIVKFVTALRPGVDPQRQDLTDQDFLLPTPLTVWKWASETFARWYSKLGRLYGKTSADMSTAERGRRMAEFEFVLGCLKSLSLVFTTLLERQPPRPLDQAPGPLERDIARHQAELFQAHLLSWFVEVGLLPLDTRGEQLFAELPGVFERRRARARDAIAVNDWHVAGMKGYRTPAAVRGQQANEEPVLFIDRIIEALGPDAAASFGPFPPSTHEPLLRLFDTAAADDPLHMERLCVVLYFLLEVQSTPTTPLAEAQSVLDRFRHAFGMPLSYERMVLGMWALDSGQDPADACTYFTDPATELVWTNVILKTLYNSGGHGAALQFYRTIPMDLSTVDDVVTVVKVLTASQLFSEAFHVIRRYTPQNPEWAEPLLWHLYAACHSTGHMPRLFQFPLDNNEEGYLVEFLEGCSVPGALDALVVYYLQRSRIAEAIRLHEFLLQQPEDLADPHRVRTRTDLVSNYRLLLPAVQQSQLAVDIHRHDVMMMEREFSPAVPVRNARDAQPLPMETEGTQGTRGEAGQRAMTTPPRTPFLHSRVNQFLQSDAVFAAPPSSHKRTSTKKVFPDIVRATAPGTPVAAFGFSQRVEPEVRRLSYGDALVSPEKKLGAKARRGGEIRTSPIPQQPRWGQSPPPSAIRTRSPQKTPRSILRQRKRPAVDPTVPEQATSRGGIVWDDTLERVKEISPNVKRSPERQSSPLTDLGPPLAANAAPSQPANPFISRRSKLATPPRTLGFAGLPDDDDDDDGKVQEVKPKAKPARRSVGFAGVDSSDEDDVAQGSSKKDESMDVSPTVPAPRSVRSSGVRFAGADDDDDDDDEVVVAKPVKKKPVRKSVGFAAMSDDDDDDDDKNKDDIIAPAAADVNVNHSMDSDTSMRFDDAAGASDDTIPTGSPQVPSSPPRRRSARLATGHPHGDEHDLFQDPTDAEVVVTPPAHASHSRVSFNTGPDPFSGIVDDDDDDVDMVQAMTPGVIKSQSVLDAGNKKAPPKASSKPQARKPATQKYNLRSKKAAPAE